MTALWYGLWAIQGQRLGAEQPVLALLVSSVLLKVPNHVAVVHCFLWQGLGGSPRWPAELGLRLPSLICALALHRS